MSACVRFAAFVVLLLAVHAFSSPAHAQVDLTSERFAFSPNLTYDSAIPAPADQLGYELGESFTLYADAVRYFETLAEASDRVTLGSYGTTYEGRPLIYLVITTPENHGRIEDIKDANQRLANPAALSDAERDRLIQEQPLITSFSYNIHGNEPASTEAAMQVAYRLAAATDAATRDLLGQMVFVMYPCINPDGRDRYVYWYRSARRHLVATDPNDLAHDEPWPQGRTNHYQFDLNRDWVWTLHPESRGLIEAYQTWMPQVHVDYHEQGYHDNYFTMPGTTPRNPLLPDSYVALADTFGRANIRAFNEHQIGYATREAFDFYYPGYGSSYPSTMGAIGMLTEQGGINAGRAVETDDGYVLTLRQRVFDHYTTSIATLQAAVRNRARLLRYFHDAHSPATNTLETAAYLLPDDNGRGYLYDVLALLRRHNIEVERAEAEFTVRDALDYRTGARSRQTMPAGTYIVRTDQPRHLFINSIMQRRITAEDSVMYDMSSWAAPIAYNLETYATTSAPSVQTSVVSEAPAPPSGVTSPNASYAYVIDWTQRHAPRALAMLWETGYRVRSAREPFDTGSRAFPEGTLIVLLGRNPDHMDRAAEDMQRIAEEAGVEIVGLSTGRMERGIDLSSRDSRPVRPPKAAMLVDQPFSVYTSGQIWYLFDQDARFPLTRIRATSLQQSGSSRNTYSRYGKADLNDYDVLVLPGTSRLGTVFDSTNAATIVDWLERGGTLVVTEGSALDLDEALGLDGETVEAPNDSVTAPPYTRYAAREDSSGLDNIPGAAFNGNLDATHPLAFGVGEQVYSLRLDEDALEPSAELQIVGYYPGDADEVLAAGYASQENIQRLAGKVFAAVRPMGDGQIIYLVDNTQYRAFWRGPSRMMLNAVMTVPGLLD